MEQDRQALEWLVRAVSDLSAAEMNLRSKDTITGTHREVTHDVDRLYYETRAAFNKLLTLVKNESL